jgi:hypothetical protein
MSVCSESGDLGSSPDVSDCEYLGETQSSQNVVVDGVRGTRSTYLVTKDLPLPPSRGTVQVRYVFVAGGRTYFLHYDRYPGDMDLTAGFDKMITGSFSFSA